MLMCLTLYWVAYFIQKWIISWCSRLAEEKHPPSLQCPVDLLELVFCLVFSSFDLNCHRDCLDLFHICVLKFVFSSVSNSFSMLAMVIMSYVIFLSLLSKILKCWSLFNLTPLEFLLLYISGEFLIFPLSFL